MPVLRGARERAKQNSPSSLLLCAVSGRFFIELEKFFAPILL